MSYAAEFSPGASESCKYKSEISTRDGAEATRALMTNGDFGRCTPLRYRVEILTAMTKERWVRMSNVRRELAEFKQFVFSAAGGELLPVFAAEIPGLSLIADHGLPKLKEAFTESCRTRKTANLETTFDNLLAAGGAIYFYRDTARSADGDRTAIREAYTYEVKVGDEWRVTPFLIRLTPVKVIR